MAEYGLGRNPISKQQAAAEASKFTKSIMNSRNIPGMLPRVAQLMNEKVHIFSVSLWPHTVSMGGWGSFYIPACPMGESYVEFKMPDRDGTMGGIPGIMVQSYPVSEHQSALHQEDGYEWAQKLLGNDLGIPRHVSLNREGIFVAAGAEPTEKELREARTELRTFCGRLVQEARDWWGDPQKRAGIQYDLHHLAAKYLNLENEPFMVDTSTEGRKKCLMCGSVCDAEVLMCGKHTPPYIFNHAAYAAMLKQQDAALAAVKA